MSADVGLKLRCNMGGAVMRTLRDSTDYERGYREGYEDRANEGLGQERVARLVPESRWPWADAVKRCYVDAGGRAHFEYL